MKPYVIGIDYGTLSGRCILLDTRTGTEVAEAVMNYPHAVMDETLPSGKKLKPHSALQYPKDYLDVLSTTVKSVLKESGVAPSEIAGIGVDFTACTLLPVDKNGNPLCFDPKFADEPNAYVKLWKHHAAQPQADRINSLAEERKEPWLPVYGGKISCEWALPKILETLEEAPEVYRNCDRFTEAGDWISRMITGKETHSASFAGFKGLWISGQGYPSNDFMRAVHPDLNGIVGTKLSDHISPISETAGCLDENGAKLTGLEVGTPVALPAIDAHAAMPALGIAGANELMLIVGTSSCHIINSEVGANMTGISGYVKDSVIPGYYTYEAGQSGVGDIFDWFVRTGVPKAYTDEALQKGISIHKLLREKVSALKPGESGLLALDWVNGNRSILEDAQLSGLVLGLTLQTKPEEIYRAWLEATAYGTRMIVDNFEEHGVKINRIVAAGGIAIKDPFMMQIYSDVMGKEIRISSCTQAGAVGSAIYASVAGGIFKTIPEAIKKLSKDIRCTYKPDPRNHQIYSAIYQEYKTLHDYFGRGGNPVMKKLLKKEY